MLLKDWKALLVIMVWIFMRKNSQITLIKREKNLNFMEK